MPLGSYAFIGDNSNLDLMARISEPVFCDVDSYFENAYDDGKLLDIKFTDPLSSIRLRQALVHSLFTLIIFCNLQPPKFVDNKAGQHIIRYLLDQGHDMLNLDLAPLPSDLGDRVHTMRVDLTNSGQVCSALGSHFRLTEPFREQLGLLLDAVIHMAGYPRNMVVPDEEIFRGNSMATYNVVEAASRLGIKRIVIAGSITVYGVTYAEGDVYYPSFPVEETTDANPMDAYAISKVCGERIARGFTRRYGSDIYVLRIERIVAPEEYKGELFRSYIQAPEKWGVHGWAYIDARGVGQMCELAVSKAGLGFQIFNAVNDEIANYMPTAEFLSRVCPEVPFHERGGHQRVPYQQQEDQGDAWIPRKTSLDAILRSIGNA